MFPAEGMGLGPESRGGALGEAAGQGQGQGRTGRGLQGQSRPEGLSLPCTGAQQSRRLLDLSFLHQEEAFV